MDSSSESDGLDMPFMEPSSYDFSQQSTSCSHELQSRYFVKLVVAHFGEVGIRFVADVHPFGQWLRTNILAFSVEFILVQPLTILCVVENLFLDPYQRGYSILGDALNRIVF